MKFQGFPRELNDFWFELHLNNTAPAQPELREDYKRLITEPLRLLYEELAPVAVGVCTELETRPARCVSSPYTDRRYEREVPFKEYGYVRFKRLDRDENVPALYFDIGGDGYGCGMCFYHQTTQGMSELRRLIAENFDACDRAFRAAERDGFSILGESYRRDHYPDLPDCPAKRALNQRRLYVGRSRAVNESVYSPALAREIADGFRSLSPLFDLLGV